LFAVFSLGSFLSIGNPGWPLLCLSMPKFMEGVCLILDNQHSWISIICGDEPREWEIEKDFEDSWRINSRSAE
ncbi:hypothetical protein, partial [Geobacillus stearothermophilus]|uniref:hypothetical protein n=1 Tax=Geobacillus stearothermophilus TaxID=1422 RepID=UPI001C7DE512